MQLIFSEVILPSMCSKVYDQNSRWLDVNWFDSMFSTAPSRGSLLVLEVNKECVISGSYMYHKRFLPLAFTSLITITPGREDWMNTPMVWSDYICPRRVSLQESLKMRSLWFRTDRTIVPENHWVTKRLMRSFFVRCVGYWPVEFRWKLHLWWELALRKT